MLRIIENASRQKIMELLQNIALGISSMVHDYIFLFSDEEVSLLKNTLMKLNEEINQIKNGTINLESIYSLLLCEDYLKPLVFRCWNFEKNNNYRFISWFKNDFIGEMPSVISATFSCNNDDTFCNSRYGISYEVFINGFLGACNKDAATLIEDKSKRSIYTIGETGDDRVINSYNLATPIITPLQTFDKSANCYKSKHNEIILDSRFIKPTSVVYFDDNDLEIVNFISEKYNLPIRFIGSTRNI